VTGPWYSQTSPYQILFGGSPVPTTLVQSGVLRCFAPANPPGLQQLEVACEGVVISNPVTFEYKANKEELRKEETRKGEKRLETGLLARLETLGLCKAEEREKLDKARSCSQEKWEELVVELCQRLTSEEGEEEEEEGVIGEPVRERQTLLHFGASLGLCRLVCSLLHWAAEYPSRRLGKEGDAMARDREGCTPLMRACASGKAELATILYHWNSTALHLTNDAGKTCAQLAGESSCPTLREELEQLDRQKRKEALETVAAKPRAFLKPRQPVEEPVKERAASVDAPRTLSSPRKTTPSSSSTASRHNRASSSSSSSAARSSKAELSKRRSVDSGINLESHNVNLEVHSQPARMRQRGCRQLSKNDRSLSLPAAAFQKLPSPPPRQLNTNPDLQPIKKLPQPMEESFDNPASPFIDVEAVTDEEEEEEIKAERSKQGVGSGGEEQAKEEQKMLSLAEQFLAAMPDRIKYEQSPGMEEEEEDTIFPDCCSQGPDCWSQSEDLGVESMADDQSVDFEFNFEEATTACQQGGYRDTSTPTSSLSPASFSLESPLSSYQASPSPSCLGFSFDHRSPPTTAEIREFLQAEKDLSNLTLSEREQRELFLAAQIIQKAYRSYKGRKKSNELERQEEGKEDKVDGPAKEAKAAVVIQNYYRRYKQYCYWKQMARAATLIQSQYRSYCEHKRFKKSQEAATCIQAYYRNYKEQREGRRGQERENTPSGGLKRTYSQRRQHQAARKIQQFMRKTHLKLVSARGATAVESGRPQTPGAMDTALLRYRTGTTGAIQGTTQVPTTLPTTHRCSLGGRATPTTQFLGPTRASEANLAEASTSEDELPEPKSYRKT